MGQHAKSTGPASIAAAFTWYRHDARRIQATMGGHHGGFADKVRAHWAWTIDIAARHDMRTPVEMFRMDQVDDALKHLAEGKAHYRIVLDANGR